MEILHIANSYGGTEVYGEMFAALDRLGVRQRVFVPLNPRNRGRAGRESAVFPTPGSAVHWFGGLGRRHRYFHGAKTAASARAALAWLGDARPDAIHAHTAFSDGAVAQALARRFGTPYAVAVRNTDVDGYWAKLFWLRGRFLGILRDAARIVFLSPETRRSFLGTRVPARLRGELEDKSLVLPNGIRDLWLRNRRTHGPVPGNPATVVYAGGFFERKGLRETVQAADRLRAEGLAVRVVAVGRGLPFRPADAAYAAEMEEMASSRPWLVLKDHVPAEGLMEEFRAADVFAMPSARETFGLVYAEALSQGLPVVWSRGEGFDGWRPDGEAGLSARAKDPADAARAIRGILADYAGFAERVGRLDLAGEFSWDGIARKYFAMYGEITGGAR